MENKNLLFAAIAVVGLLALGLLGFIGYQLYFYYLAPPEINNAGLNLPLNTNIDGTGTTTSGMLPITPDNPDAAARISALEKLEKEKQFISQFWTEPQKPGAAKAAAYKLPFASIKEQVANYRDFSRKINIESALAMISANGFAVIDSPFGKTMTDWETNFKLLQQNKVPIFISADAATGIYLDTLGVAFREIEEEIFYQSLWSLLKEEFDKVQQRYKYLSKDTGIETDLITEANRLELAYLSVGLKLLMPDPSQVRESLAGDYQYFSPQEAESYAFKLPLELKDEVENEIKLISAKTPSAKSPIFLFTKSYGAYDVPEYYRTSEKLKNFYLAKTWLSDILFPLWNQSDDCPKCLLDDEDQTINFVAGLYLTSDLAGNQNLKNRWANIYKPIAFFRGTESNLTYLYYEDALVGLFGKDYDLDKLFSVSLDDAKKIIKDLQKRISEYPFNPLLFGSAEIKENKGLRLLRQQYILEEKIFGEIIGPGIGAYSGATENNLLPFSACKEGNNVSRCAPTALDLFNIFGNPTAKKIIAQTRNGSYTGYDNYAADFAAALGKLDSGTWHENNYLGLIWSLRYLAPRETPGLPTFMKTAAWDYKTLNTGLGAWVGFHREINFERVKAEEETPYYPDFLYGYVEPQPYYYRQLLANVEMIRQGFTSLQIILPGGKTAERLNSLKLLLENLIRISELELQNKSLSADDYTYLNYFYRQIRLITGDIKKESLANRYGFSRQIDRAVKINENVDGLDYAVVVYPGGDDKVLFAIGPVYNYIETKNQERNYWTWTNEFKVNQVK